MPTDVQLTSTSQLPRSGGQAPTRPDTIIATSWARLRLRACTLIIAPLDARAIATARADPPAPSIATRAPSSATPRSLSGERNPDASVFPPSQRPPDARMVLIAPIRRA